MKHRCVRMVGILSVAGSLVAPLAAHADSITDTTTATTSGFTTALIQVGPAMTVVVPGILGLVVVFSMFRNARKWLGGVLSRGR